LLSILVRTSVGFEEAQAPCPAAGEEVAPAEVGAESDPTAFILDPLMRSVALKAAQARTLAGFTALAPIIHGGRDSTREHTSSRLVTPTTLDAMSWLSLRRKDAVELKFEVPLPSTTTTDRY
jgi:hypothetical protein